MFSYKNVPIIKKEIEIEIFKSIINKKLKDNVSSLGYEEECV